MGSQNSTVSTVTKQQPLQSSVQILVEAIGFFFFPELWGPPASSSVGTRVPPQLLDQPGHKPTSI